MSRSLQTLLFPADGEKTYAIIDGASCGELLAHLDAMQPGYVCLYSGELTPDVEEVAPYLVELLPGHRFTDWLLAHIGGKPWGIFVRSSESLRALRKHFRTLLLVQSPEAKVLYFRYYDPRVLTSFLPRTNHDERLLFFGHVSTFFCETAGGDLVSYRRHGGDLDQQNYPANDVPVKG